jgi:hypothetical protein
VAIAATPVETQGRRVIPFVVGNHGRRLELAVDPLHVRPGGTLRIGVRGADIEGAVVFAMGRVLGRTATPEASIEVPADVLGAGPVTIRATGRAGPTPADCVNAEPVTVEVGRR